MDRLKHRASRCHTLNPLLLKAIHNNYVKKVRKMSTFNQIFGQITGIYFELMDVLTYYLMPTDKNRR